MCAESIRHSRSVSPWFIPNVNGVGDDLHGITNIGGGSSVDAEEVFVVGKREKCGTDKSIPDASISITQLERGEIQSYLTLAGLDAEPSGGFSLSDFENALTDVVLYEKDSFEGTLEQSFWFPKMSIESMGFNIADPEAKIERTFDMVGDNELVLNYANKYLIHVKDTAGSAVSGNYIIDVSDPEPVADPNNSGAYILRIDRTRSGVTTTLDLGTDYTFDPSPDEITIIAATADDVYNIYYSAGSFGSAGDPTSTDGDSTCFLKAENVTVLISDGTTELELDLLTSLTIDTTFNRIDEAVIGNDEKVIKEVESSDVDVALSGRIKTSTIQEAFMGELGNNWGITDVSKFVDTVRVTVKIYSDSTKATFLIGYQVDNLTFTEDDQEFTANEFGTLNISSSSDNLKITTTVGDLT